MLAIRGRSFAAIGEAMIEFAPTPHGDYRRGFAGDTYNTLWHMAQLQLKNSSARFVTKVGLDKISESFVTELRGSAISASGVARDPNLTMGLYLIELDGVERSFHYWRSAAAARKLASDANVLSAALADVDLIHLSGITLAILPPEGRDVLFETIDRCRRQGAIVSFDPNIRARLWAGADEMRSTLSRMLSLTDIGLPSFDDEKQHWGDKSPLHTVDRMLKSGVREVVVKNGPATVALHGDGRTTEHQTPMCEKIVDTTGAGDSFNAGYLAARLEGATPEAVVRFAQNLAALVIGYYGAKAPVSEVRKLGEALEQR